MQKYDVAVIGLGAMGSAAVYQLAKSGVKILGIDQFEPPHIYGSSHGETRITRQAIAEGKEYVPLVLRANEIWKEIEAQIGEELYTQTGILIMASNTTAKPNKFVDDTIAAAKQYGIDHSELTIDDIRKRFQQFKVTGGEKAYFEEGAGFLYAERCIESQRILALRHGAKLQANETMLSYKQRSDGILVKTNKGEYLTQKLILTVGPWVQNFLPQEYKGAIKIYRQVLYWFELEGDPSRYEVGRFPVFNWEFNTAHEDFIYGFPSIDGKSIKVAAEHYGSTTTPRDINRVVTEDEVQTMYKQYIQPYLDGVSNRCLRAEACLYSVAPDWRFLIDFMPGNKNVILASPCSGHGFKHSAAIGEVLMQLATKGKSDIDISKFSFDKLNVGSKF